MKNQIIDFAELQDNREAALTAARAIVATAEDEDRDLTDKEFQSVKALRDNALAIDKHMTDLRCGMGTALGTTSDATNYVGRVNTGDGSTFTAPDQRDKSYASMFGTTDHGGYPNPDDFFRSVYSGNSQPTIGASMGSLTGAGGGFSVPTQQAAQWLDSSLEKEKVRPRASVYPMSGDTLKVVGFDSSTHTSSRYGGLTTRWVQEGTQLTVDDAALRLIQLTAHKGVVYARASNEVAKDGQGFTEQIGTAMRDELAFSLDGAFLTGDGAGKPLGILNANALVTQDKEVGQAAATIKYENLVNMYSRLAPGSHDNSVWICNHDCLPQLMTLTLGIGAGGMHFQVLNETDGRFFILGREVLTTEHLPTLGTTGDILLCDLSKYAIGLRADIDLARSGEVRFDFDQTDFRSIVRVDGMPTWNAPITPKVGANTLSPFVALETRA